MSVELLPGVRMLPDQIFILALALAVVVCLHLFLTYSRTGIAMRAMAESRRSRRCAASRSMRSCAGHGSFPARLPRLRRIRRPHAAASSRSRLQPAARAFRGGDSRRHRKPRRGGDRGPARGLAENLSLLFISAGYKTAMPFLVLLAVLIVRPQGCSARSNDRNLFLSRLLCLHRADPRDPDARAEPAMGFTGLFNAGIVGFYAIGAYTHAILTAAPQPQYLGNLGLPWIVGIAAAMAATALAAWVIGLLTIRLRGDYLAIARSA
jgi:hypothetical protein